MARRRSICTRHIQLLIAMAIGVVATADAPATDDECMRQPPPRSMRPGALLQIEVEFAECLFKQSAELMTADLTDRPFDRPKLARIIDEAMTALNSARELAERATARGDELTPGIRDRLEMLTAFGETWRAIASADGSPEAAKRLTTASIELALYTDDTSPHIAEAAKLWQAHAYRKAGRADRTLQMLHPIMTAGTGSRVDLFLRLERCRALADAGQYIAAVTLAIKIEGKIDEWMQRESKETRDAARVTVQTARAEILNRWAVALRGSGTDERAKEAESAATAITQSIKQSNIKPLILDALVVGLDEPTNVTTQPTN